MLQLLLMNLKAFILITGQLFLTLLCTFTFLSPLKAETPSLEVEDHAAGSIKSPNETPPRCPLILSGVSNALDFSPDTSALDEILYDWIQDKLSPLNPDVRTRVLDLLQLSGIHFVEAQKEKTHGSSKGGKITLRNSLFRHPFGRPIFVHEFQHLLNFVFGTYMGFDALLKDERSATQAEYQFIHQTFDRVSLTKILYRYSPQASSIYEHNLNLVLYIRYTGAFELTEKQYVKRHAETLSYKNKNHAANLRVFEAMRNAIENSRRVEPLPSDHEWDIGQSYPIRQESTDSLTESLRKFKENSKSGKLIINSTLDKTK